MITVKVEKASLKIVVSRLEKAVKGLLRELAEYAEEEMRRQAPERTGRLRRSIRKRLNLAALEVEVGPDVEYAVYVEYGTHPHVIRPVRAEALRFEVEGEIVFARLVRHPGTKPNPFVRRTAEQTHRQIPRLWREKWKETA
jgi:HK97 gp10 family phage protein